MAGQKRTKTKYPGINFNETTQKYDVKYNYKVYNPLTKKNDYKQKWTYNFLTLTEARAELVKLQAGGVKPEDKDITEQVYLQFYADIKKNACKKIGIPIATCHDFRHTSLNEQN